MRRFLLRQREEALQVLCIKALAGLVQLRDQTILPRKHLQVGAHGSRYGQKTMRQTLAVHQRCELSCALLAHAADAERVHAQTLRHHRNIDALAAHVHADGTNAVRRPLRQRVHLHGFIKGRIHANAGNHRFHILSWADYSMKRRT